MRKKTCRKIVTMLLVTALTAGTALTGCGKKSVDYDVSDDGSGGDGGNLASKLNIPDSYEGTLDGIDSETGLTEVSIKASSITVPDTDKMSVLYYQDNTVDSEYRKRVCESFFDVSAGIYVYDWEKPYKEDVERSIETYKQYAEQASDDDDRTYWEDMVSDAQEQLKTATTEREGAGDYSADTYVGTVGENSFMLSFYGSGEDGSGGFGIDYYPTDSLIDYKPMEGATSVYSYSSDYTEDDDSTNQASLSKDDAVQRALEFLASCGITDVVETNVTDLTWEYTDSDYNTVATEKNGYYVSLQRSVDGIAPYTPYVYNIDFLASDDIWYSSSDETFEFNVDDNGIISAYCYDLFRATGDKDENVDLLTWDEALEKLPSAINTCYTANSSSYSSIEFNDVRLAYYRVKDGTNYKYIPVWSFAQCDTTDGDELDTSYPVQLVMIDAVTGDYVDLTQVLDSESYDDSESDTIVTDDEDALTIDEDGNIVDGDGNVYEMETDEDSDSSSDDTDESSDGDSSDETDETSDDSSDETDDTTASIDDASEE